MRAVIAAQLQHAARLRARSGSSRVERSPRAASLVQRRDERLAASDGRELENVHLAEQLSGVLERLRQAEKHLAELADGINDVALLREQVCQLDIAFRECLPRLDKYDCVNDIEPLRLQLAQPDLPAAEKVVTLAVTSDKVAPSGDRITSPPRPPKAPRTLAPAPRPPASETKAEHSAEGPPAAEVHKPPAPKGSPPAPRRPPASEATAEHASEGTLAAAVNKDGGSADSVLATSSVASVVKAKPPCDADLLLGKYQVLEGSTLGEGGWCIVKRGRHVDSGLEVAVKTYRDQSLRTLGDAAVVAARFAREVEHFRLLGLSHRHERLPHSGVDPRSLFVNLLDFSCAPHSLALAPADDGRFYAILELAEQPLDAWLKQRREVRRPRPLGRSGGPDFVSGAELRELAAALAEGLSWLHSQGICHMDLKPSNIMRFGGRWKIIDLEGCSSLIAESDLSMDSFTPMYACPELAGAVLAKAASGDHLSTTLAGVALSEKFDVWSAGVILLDVLAHGEAFSETWNAFQEQAFMSFDDEPDPTLGFVEQWYQWLSAPDELVISDLVKEPASSVALLERCPELPLLLRGLLAKSPSNRSSTQDFKEHAFLRADAH